MSFYHLVVLNHASKFEARVSALLAEGWECAGGVQVDSEGYFYQAMFLTPPRYAITDKGRAMLKGEGE